TTRDSGIDRQRDTDESIRNGRLAIGEHRQGRFSAQGMQRCRDNHRGRFAGVDHGTLEIGIVELNALQNAQSLMQPREPATLGGCVSETVFLDIGRDGAQQQRQFIAREPDVNGGRLAKRMLFHAEDLSKWPRKNPPASRIYLIIDAYNVYYVKL